MCTKLSQPQMIHVFLPDGRWLDCWVQNGDEVRQFIAVQGLRPVSMSAPAAAGTLAAGAPGGVEKTGGQRSLGLALCGGSRASHLHFEDDVYLLNDEQWATFSRSVLKHRETLPPQTAAEQAASAAPTPPAH